MTLPKTGRSSVFPATPIDGQVFVDSEFVRWVYNAKIGLWERGGTVDSIPLATPDNDGYLSRQHKKALDLVSTVNGGFGIIVDPKSILRTADNPNGVIQGPIEIKSDSIDISCVSDSLKVSKKVNASTVKRSLTETNCAPQNNLCTVSGQLLPGLQFKPKDVFLDTLVIDLPGPTGKQGESGYKGETGANGYSNGPQGIKGKTGADVDELYKLSNITYSNKSGITEEAIVDLRMANDEHGCKLIVTKAELDIPDGRPADKLVATPLSRSIIYADDTDTTTCNVTRLDNWRLVKSPGDNTQLDLQLLRLAKGSNDRDEAIGFNGTLTLTGFITAIVQEYKDRLTKLDKMWGKQVKEYIENIDDKARTILSNLANELAMCEFNLPAMEYCITFGGTSPSPSASTSSTSSNVPPNLGAPSTMASKFNMGSKSWRAKI